MPEAEKNWLELSKTVDLKRIYFEGFGTDLIKKAKLSPDSLIQMVLQLSYYKIHKQGCPTYETGKKGMFINVLGHTRQYYHGRTDNVRTFSVESVNFCKTMVTKDATAEEKWKALYTAIEAHKGYLNDVLNGTGEEN